MKNLLILLLFSILGATPVLGQIQKGTIEIGGNLSMSGRSDASNTFDFSFSPYIGKFISPSSLLGVGTGYEHSSWGNDDKTKHNLVLLNPYYEKYLVLSEKFYFTAKAGFGVGYGKTESDNSKSNTFRFEVSINPGLVYFLNNNLALNARVGSLYYRFDSEKDTSENPGIEETIDNEHSYGLSLEFNTFSLGLQYFLRTKND